MKRIEGNRVLPILGMAFMWPSIHNQVLYPLTLTFNKTGVESVFFFYLVYAFIAIATIALLVFSQLRRARLLDSKPAMVAFGIIGMLGFAAMALCGFESTASIAAIGIGASMFALYVPAYFGFWSLRLVDGSPSIVQDTLASYAIACLLQAVRLALGVHTVVFGFTCIALSVACVLATRIRPITYKLRNDLESIKACPAKLAGPAFLLLCLLFAGVLFINPPSAALHYPPTVRTYMYVFSACACGVLMAINRIGIESPFHASMLSLAFLAALSIICMLLTGFGRPHLGEMGNFALIGVKVVIEMYLWAIVLHTVQLKRLRLFAIMGIYLIATVLLPNTISAFSLHMGFFESSEDAMLIIIMTIAALVACAVLNLMLAALLFGSKQDGEAVAQTAKAKNPLDNAFEQFQRAHEFSDRQMDVVRLAYKNWTSKRIGEELFISEGTVKTHLKTIYKRAEIHSKQDLIDAVDSFKMA